MVLWLHMRNSAVSSIFSDFQSDFSKVAVSRALVKGNEGAWYENWLLRARVPNRYEHALSHESLPVGPTNATKHQKSLLLDRLNANSVL